MDIAKKEFGFFWNKGHLGNDEMLQELLSGKHKFGDILLRLLAEVSKRRSAPKIVIVLDALDEISRRIQESSDALEDGFFDDGTQYLMHHLVKPIVNQRFDGLTISVIFSCLKPVSYDHGYARHFEYIDCQKCDLTPSDKDAILNSWKMFWVQKNSTDEGCDSSTEWISQVMRLLSHQCFQHGDLRVLMLLLWQ